MPERLDAEYVERGRRAQTPLVMLHRAIVGSLERFIGILDRAARRRPARLAGADPGGGLQYHRCAGRLRQEVVKSLQNKGWGQADLRNEKITYKIREHSVQAAVHPGRGRQGEGNGALRCAPEATRTWG